MVNFIFRYSVKIGKNLYFSSGWGVNALCANKRGVIYATEHASIKIGDNVGMSSTVLWAHNKIVIGNYVKIGGNCILIDTDAHNLDFSIRRGQYTDWGESAPIVVEDDAFIGANCIILKGVTIGARSINCCRVCGNEKHTGRLCGRRKSG